MSFFGNPLSATGFLLAFGAGFGHLSLFLLDLFSGGHNPYLNILLYLILPPIVVLGFVLSAIGARRERRRALQEEKIEGRPVPAERVRKIFFTATLVVAFLLVPFVAVTSYEGYHYTDSVEFCGRVCHEVMNPAYTAYQVSAHARVDCANCHIGEGASWFVRSKLSGIRQVFATIRDSFHRPIKTPLETLRPARETCERCHWPEKDFGDRVRELPHFASNEQNTARPLAMVLHTGGGDPELHPLTGIHWHVSKMHTIEYVAADPKRIEIPWVRMTTEDGVRVFRSDGRPAEAPPPEGERRTMDCIDCHNRPSHRYQPPDALLNRFFAAGLLDRDLPFLKREAARSMAVPYASTAAADEAIAGGLREFYRTQYPEVFESKREAIESSIDGVLMAFHRSIFPEMKTDWRVHPDHIGHKYFPGCYRCHDDRHVDAGGSTISKDCAACHDFLQRQTVEGAAALVRGGYRHPYPLEAGHEAVECYACHTGGPTPPSTCAGCHTGIRDFIAGTLPLPAGAAGSPLHDSLDCGDCHDEPKRIERDEIVPLCVFCHDEKFAPRAEEMLARIDDARTAAAEAAAAGGPGSAEIRAVLEQLERARPIHNPDFALELLHRSKQRGSSP